jgi:hypothetical protein
MNNGLEPEGDIEENHDGDEDLDLELNNGPTSTPTPQAVLRGSNTSAHVPTSTPTPQPILRSNASVHHTPVQPSSLGKRKSPSATQPSADNIRVIKTIKSEPSGTRNRLIARDLPSMFQGILADA